MIMIGIRPPCTRSPQHLPFNRDDESIKLDQMENLITLTSQIEAEGVDTIVIELQRIVIKPKSKDEN